MKKKGGTGLTKTEPSFCFATPTFNKIKLRHIRLEGGKMREFSSIFLVRELCSVNYQLESRTQLDSI